jgi:hypothetical protein
MKKLFLLAFLFLTAAIAVADPPGPPGPGGNPGGTGGVPVGSPIDGTTFFLLIIAIAYGVYKLLEFRRNNASGDISK